MTTQPDYLRYLESAKQAELAEQLRNSGYVVETDKQVGALHFDLVASKGGEKVVYEFKSVGNARLNKEKLGQIQLAARSAGYDFRIVIVNPPPRVKVEIEHLTEHLFDYVMENTPNDLHLISSSAQVDGVTDVDISDIQITESGIRIKGVGAIDVTLHYGGSRDGVTNTDAYPFRFVATLEADGSLASVDEFSVDTSAFFE